MSEELYEFVEDQMRRVQNPGFLHAHLQDALEAHEVLVQLTTGEPISDTERSNCRKLFASIAAIMRNIRGTLHQGYPDALIYAVIALTNDIASRCNQLLPRARLDRSSTAVECTSTVNTVAASIRRIFEAK